MADKTSLSRWTIQDSRELYGIENWGGPYFNISDAGEVQVQLGSNGSSQAVSLLEILRGVEDRGMTMQQALNLWHRKAAGSHCNYGFHMAISEWDEARAASSAFVWMKVMKWSA